MIVANNTCYGYLLPCDLNGSFMPLTKSSSLSSFVSSKQNSSRLSNILLKINGSNVYINNLNLTSKVYVNGTQIIDAVLNNGDIISAYDNEFMFLRTKLDITNIESKNYNWKKELSKLLGFATTNHPVLLVGESGTGKDVISRFIHQSSKRNGKPFISINCSTLTENMIESELFGHKKGSFTGSVNDRKGAFLASEGGTLFLDEIGDLPIHLQPKLLRALENKEIKPLGSDRSIKTDVRFISATHRDLKDLIRQGKFRSDLYYRLNVISIHIPPLRDRTEDIEPLLFKLSLTNKVKFSDCAVDVLKSHTWPGNIRELKNFVSRVSAIHRYKTLYKSDLSNLLELENCETENYEIGKSSEQFEKNEKKMMLKILDKHKGNVRKAAQEFKVSRGKFYYNLKKWGIKPNELASKFCR